MRIKVLTKLKILVPPEFSGLGTISFTESLKKKKTNLATKSAPGLCYKMLTSLKKN